MLKKNIKLQAVLTVAAFPGARVHRGPLRGTILTIRTMRGCLFFGASLLPLLAAFPGAMRAGDAVMCLQVTQADGAQVLFALSTAPAITHENDCMVITVGDELGLQVSLDEIVEYRYVEADPTGAGGVGNPAEVGVSASFSGGRAWVTGLGSGERVCLYASDGRLVSSVAASADGSACVDLEGLGGGVVYLLRTPGATYKVLGK